MAATTREVMIRILENDKRKGNRRDFPVQEREPEASPLKSWL